ncbi:MAG: zinc-dependent alcohol dehydrogenase family protein [Bacteroidetes bacterium]|nr:zinc-dependent alcohol dehydrogenase family protein [Bacteroidota bacterium]
MKALVLESYNTPFQLKEVPTPIPQKGHVLVKIHASGINPLDIKIFHGAAGHAQTKLPAILGLDMAGTVIESPSPSETRPGAPSFKPGDRVYGLTGGVGSVQGSLAEYAAVDPDLLALAPKNLDLHDTATLPLVFITAWEGLVDRAQIQPKQTVLIHGGSGGVGNIAIQIAKALGAEVYSTVSPSKQHLVESLGAIPIDYTDLSVDAYTQRYTNGSGFDVVLDTLGGETLNDTFKSVKRYTGHAVSILGWGTHSIAPLSFRGATYSGVFTLYPLISGEHRAHHGDILRQATTLIEAGKIKPFVDPTPYTMESIADAYQAIETAKNNGKIAVSITNP